MKTNQLVVSLHDVTPARFEACRLCTDMLDRLGIRSSLLVVPNYHDVRMDSDPAFIEWLRVRESLGDELVLHGYRHKVEHKPSGFMAGIQCSLFSRMECEFLGLSADQFNTLINNGMELFKRNGFSSAGFVPPSWLVDNHNLPLLKSHGIRYATRQYRFFELESGKSLFSPAVVLWGATTRMNKLSRFYNNMMLPLLRTNRLVRIALHPPDAEMGALDWFARIIEKSAKSHSPVTYEQCAKSVGESAGLDD